MPAREGSRVLVTGAAGFVGASVARRLLARGYEVHALIRRLDSTWRLADLLARVTLHEADIKEEGAAARALRAARPLFVVHCATHGAYEAQSHARTILETNVLGSAELFAACAEANVELVVNLGSSSEYGFRSEAMREADRLEPNSIYAVAKAAQTHLAALLSRRGKPVLVTFRLFSVYGPFEEPSRLVPTLLRNARAGLDLELASPDTARDFVYVDDVVDALVDFDRMGGLNGEVFNLGSGRQTSLEELVAAVLELTKSRSRPRWHAFPARHWDARTWLADISKARERLGWLPRHGLLEGLSKTLAWTLAAEREHAGDRS